MAATYVPPLRFAVQWCVETAKTAGITAPTVATIAQVAEDRAAAYLSILVARTALINDRERFTPGPAWQEWASTPTRTRPKRGFSTSANDMDRLRRTLCDNLTRRRQEMGITQYELAKRAGVDKSYVYRAEKYSDPPPACVLILLAKVMETTIEQLV